MEKKSEILTDNLLKKQRSKSRRIRCSSSKNKKKVINELLKIRQNEIKNKNKNNDNNDNQTNYNINRGIFLFIFLIFLL